MKAALTICLMLLCTHLHAQQNSLQNSDVKILKTKLTKIHKGVKSRFRYKSPTGPEKFEYYTSYDSVRGDCDDFASAAYYELWKRGADPILYTYDYVGGRSRYRHVIVCALGFCFDNNNDHVFYESKFHRSLKSWAYELVEGGSGQLNEEKMIALYQTEQQLLQQIN